MDNANTPLGTPAGEGSGLVTKKYSVGDARKVGLIGPGTATITRGASGVLTLSARQADFEHLEVKVSGEGVDVAFRGGLIRNRGPEGQIRYELTVPILEELKLSGGVAAEATDIDSRKLHVELQDASSLTLAGLRASEFEAKVEDAGRLSAAGAVTEQKVKLGGGSVYQGGGVQSEETEVDASDKSEATVRAGKKLKVKAAGGSTVAYSGDGIDLDVQTHGGSVFRHITG